ncbi:MAG: hypothetical protein ACTSR2_06420 [Candidatus Hodarchaeales archaeon]
MGKRNYTSSIWLLIVFIVTYNFINISIFESITVFLSIVFTRELFLALFSRKNDLKIIIKNNTFAYIENNEIWVHVFETKNIDDIQWSELSQLKHLRCFSLVFSPEKRKIKLFVYSKIFDQLESIISTTKPIIDVLLPDNYPLEKNEVTSLLKQYTLSFYKKLVIIEDENSYYLPETDLNIEYFDAMNISNIEMVLTYNIDKKPSQKAGIYYLKTFRKDYFFGYLIRKTLSEDKFGHLNLKDYQKLRLRFNIRISKHYDLDSAMQELHKLKEGISKPRKVNPKNLSTKVNKIINLSDTTEVTDRSEIKSNSAHHTSESYTYSKKPQITEGQSCNTVNQICFEFCNIFNHAGIDKSIKEKKCLTRSNFSKKLLRNENFQSLIENVLKQKDKIEMEHLIKELIQRISLQQLICILSHVLYFREKEIPTDGIENTIHILIEEIHSRSNLKKENGGVIHQESYPQNMSNLA